MKGGSPRRKRQILEQNGYGCKEGDLSGRPALPVGALRHPIPCGVPAKCMANHTRKWPDQGRGVQRREHFTTTPPDTGSRRLPAVAPRPNHALLGTERHLPGEAARSGDRLLRPTGAPAVLLRCRARKTSCLIP